MFPGSRRRLKPHVLNLIHHVARVLPSPLVTSTPSQSFLFFSNLSLFFCSLRWRSLVLLSDGGLKMSRAAELSTLLSFFLSFLARLSVLPSLPPSSRLRLKPEPRDWEARQDPVCFCPFKAKKQGEVFSSRGEGGKMTGRSRKEEQEVQ